MKVIVERAHVQDSADMLLPRCAQTRLDELRRGSLETRYRRRGRGEPLPARRRSSTQSPVSQAVSRAWRLRGER